MPPSPLERLTIYAEALLDASVDILNTTTALAPTSQFLASGRPAFDCEFVAVQVTRLAEDATSPTSVLSTKKRNHFGNIILATFVIYVVRCGPNISSGLPPNDASKTSNASLVFEDGWAIWNGIRDVQDELFDDCLGIYFDGGLPLPDSGGYVGWQFTIRASIPGYVP